MKALWHVLAGRRRQFLLIVILESLSGGVEALFHPLLVKALFDQAIIAKNFDRFLTLGLFYLLLGFTLNSGSYWIASWRKRYENTTVLAIEMELLDRTMALDSRKISSAGNASFVSRIHNDVYEGVLPSIDTAIQVSRQAIASATFVGVLLYLSWQASLILLVIVPPLFAFSKHLAKKIERNTESEREAEAQYINKLTRTLEAFHGTRGLSLLYPGVKRANAGMLGNFLGITYVNFRLGQKQRTVSDIVMNVSDTASMVVGAYFVFAGRLSFGGFLAFVNSLWRALTGVFFVINALPQFRRNAAVLARIDSLRTSASPQYFSCGNLVLVSGARVKYESGPEVAFEHFELAAGERVLLRGPNGGGKTTLLHIIAGTLAPDVGLVTRPQRVAQLSAPVQLPPLTVNELVADPSLRDRMGLLSLGDQTPATLSSGQRQRVGVAALLSEDADVYIVDEPFANLDADGRELVLQLLLERTAGRGLLVVHHGDEELNARFDRVVSLTATAAQPR
jgi:ABC-type bacteriocin/lantibiotic exporter with double-glycine peptidase domain